MTDDWNDVEMDAFRRELEAEVSDDVGFHKEARRLRKWAKELGRKV